MFLMDRRVLILKKLSEAGNARQGFFEADEFEGVLAHLPDYLVDACRFAYLTGWRKGEVVALRWDGVDAAAGTLTLPDSKNGRGRLLALTGDMADIFERREEARLLKDAEGEPRVADLVFHRRGRRLADFKRAWHAALVKAGCSHREKDPKTGTVRVDDRTFHAFRRTAARDLTRAGVPRDVAMGHKTDSMFSRYNIVDTRDVARAIEQVSRRK